LWVITSSDVVCGAATCDVASGDADVVPVAFDVVVLDVANVFEPLICQINFYRLIYCKA
jgi:hypothetical protein